MMTAIVGQIGPSSNRMLEGGLSAHDQAAMRIRVSRSTDERASLVPAECQVDDANAFVPTHVRLACRGDPDVAHVCSVRRSATAATKVAFTMTVHQGLPIYPSRFVQADRATLS